VMTPERVDAARKMRADGVPVTQIAATFGVTRVSVAMKKFPLVAS